ncbi:CPBP family intramembrane glutamic endopeptidase [Salinimicrobium sp. TIG7-5_MAKvit]|uniref:CPBP family intramembrane glutamic endopeptidase n=1 Tax=Salinimicrobium sp. TIG7-5_MAKvit TaxID=3121289 RepID=UPI003C6E78C1
MTIFIEPLILLAGTALIYKYQKIENPFKPVYLKIFLTGTLLTFFVELAIELTALLFENDTQIFNVNSGYNFTIIPFYLIGIFIAALFEELVFRHYFYETIGKALKGIKILFIVLSSFIFTLPHFQYYQDYLILTSTFMFGTLYAYLFIEYKSLWVPLGVHVGHNLFDYLLGNDIVNLTSNNSILYGSYRPIFTAIEILAIIFLIKKLCPTPVTVAQAVNFENS